MTGPTRAPMLVPVRIRRLTAATLVCATLVLGVSMLVAAGHAGVGNAAGNRQHTCSVLDRQFIQTVQSQMTQLGYWSDELVAGNVRPGTVIRQTRSESRQVAATGPTDPSLLTARSLLRKMFLEYGAAVRAKALGGSPGLHVQTAYTLANAVHDLLVDAQPALRAEGCEVAPLLTA
jgi:hypothetical protein